MTVILSAILSSSETKSSSFLDLNKKEPVAFAIEKKQQARAFAHSERDGDPFEPTRSFSQIRARASTYESVCPTQMRNGCSEELCLVDQPKARAPLACGGRPRRTAAAASSAPSTRSWHAPCTVSAPAPRALSFSLDSIALRKAVACSAVRSHLWARAPNGWMAFAVGWRSHAGQ